MLQKLVKIMFAALIATGFFLSFGCLGLKSASASTPFLGEIKLFSFNIVPKGYLPCNGQLLPINSNQALFSILGTSYGGDGRVNFALPDLRGRALMHSGSTWPGTQGGAEAVTLTISQLPTHSHNWASTNPAGASVPGYPAQAQTLDRRPVNIYSNTGVTQLPASPTIGGGQPHTNIQPYLALNYCIAVQGIFPSQN